MAVAVPVTVTCPTCRKPFVTQVRNIIDVGAEPELKQAFLQGQVNVATCPSCGQSGMMALPLLYNDPDKQLLLAYVPDQLNMKLEDREKMIGELVNALMKATPPEKRKAYLFQPKTMLSPDRMIEEILLGDGITKEMLDAQRKAVALIQDLLDTKDDEQRLQAMVEEHKAELDYQFFLLLSASISGSAEAGDAEAAQDLEDLRAKLLDILEPALPEPLPADASKDELIDKMLAAEGDEALRGVVISNLHMVDYAFYQALTSRLEAREAAGETAQAEQLAALRAKLLELTQELEQQAREAQQATIALIEALSTSEDQEQAIREHAAEYDNYLFAVLGGMIDAARNSGQSERADKLELLQNNIVNFMEQNMPPELRLLSSLLGAEYPGETKQILEEHASELSADLVAAMNDLATGWEGRGAQEAADKMRQVIEQAKALLPEADADEEWKSV